MATRCSPPTRISLNKSVQIPGQSVILTWSGATPGSGTTIRGYSVYRATSQSGDYNLLINTSSTSCSVDAPDSLARGTFYYYKILTRGSTTGTDSLIENSPVASLKANTLPGAPSVKQDKAKLPSNTDSSHPATIKFEVTPGSDSDGQSLGLAYSLDNGTTKTRFTSPLSLSFTGATTVKFYTFDGLEYGAITAKEMVKNVKPTIEFGTVTKTTYNALGGSGASGSQRGYASAISPRIDTNKGGTVTLGIEYYYSNGTEEFTTSGTGYDYKTMKQVVLTPPDMGTVNWPLGDFNIHDFIPQVTSTNLHWRIYARLNDGIETTDWVYYPSLNSGEYYSIARASEVTHKYNQFGNSDKTGTNFGEMWRDVRLVLWRDYSVSKVTVVAKENNQIVLDSTAVVHTSDEQEPVTGITSNDWFIDVTLPDAVSSGATINFEIHLICSESFEKISYITMKETEYPIFPGGTAYGARIIKPFTDTGSFEVLTPWPFGTESELTSTVLAKYNCDTTAANAIKIVYSSDNSTYGSQDKYELSDTWNKNGDNLVTSISKATVYPWNHALGIESYSDIVTYYCRVEIKNLFGKITYSPWCENTFDFREAPASAEIQSIEWSSDNENWSTLTTGQTIQEGMYLRLNCIFGIYSTDDIKVSILVEDNLQKREINCVDPDYNIQPTQTYRVTSSNGILVRSEPNTSGDPIGSIRYGKEFDSNTVVIGQNIDGVNTWVYYDEEEGYVTGRYLVPTPEVKGITTPFTYPRNLITYPGRRLDAPAQNVKSFVYHITNEITNAADKKWSIQIETTGGVVESAQVTTPVMRQCAPDLVLEDCEVEKVEENGQTNYYFTYTYSMTDEGFEPGEHNTLTTYLCDNVTKDNMTAVLPSSSDTVASLTSDWDVKTISVKSVSVVEGLITNTKTYYSNAITTYKLAPTVAYRKNQIGINTDELDSDATVVIQQATGKQKLIIKGVTPSPDLIPTKFEIDASTGTISFYKWDSTLSTPDYVLLHTLDLSRGQIDPTSP